MTRSKFYCVCARACVRVSCLSVCLSVCRLVFLFMYDDILFVQRTSRSKSVSISPSLSVYVSGCDTVHALALSAFLLCTRAWMHTYTHAECITYLL
jgi:hypothetical protein